MASRDLATLVLGVEERLAAMMVKQFGIITDRLDALDAVLLSGKVSTPLGIDVPAAAHEEFRATSSVLSTTNIVDTASGAAVQAQSGVIVGVDLACRAVLRACEKLETEQVNSEHTEKLKLVKEHLQLPLTPQRSAKAAELAVEVRNFAKALNAPDCEQLSKIAALTVREALVLQICCLKGSTSDVAFEYALEKAFQRTLSTDERSKLHLARSAQCRLGRDRTTHDRAAPKIWGTPLSLEELEALFAAYSECANSATFDKSQANADKNRRKKKRLEKGEAAEGPEWHEQHRQHSEAVMQMEMEPWFLHYPDLIAQSSWEQVAVPPSMWPAEEVQLTPAQLWLDEYLQD